MKPWIVDPRAAEEIDDTAGWYEDRREGPGFAFLEALDPTLILIAIIQKPLRGSASGPFPPS